MKKTLASILLALGIVATGAVAANAATTYTYPQTRCIGSNLYRYTIYRVDYNWYEEVFLGKRDYTYAAWGPLIQYNAPQCGVIYV